MNENHNPERLVQIMPAPGWKLLFGGNDEDSAYLSPLMGWGLTAAGDIVTLDTDCTGWTEAVEVGMGNCLLLLSPDDDHSFEGDLITGALARAKRAAEAASQKKQMRPVQP